MGESFCHLVRIDVKSLFGHLPRNNSHEKEPNKNVEINQELEKEILHEIEEDKQAEMQLKQDANVAQELEKELNDELNDLEKDIQIHSTIAANNSGNTVTRFATDTKISCVNNQYGSLHIHLNRLCQKI